MSAFVLQSSGIVVTVILPGQGTAGVAALAPLPVGAMAVAVVVHHLADVVGIVVTQHPVALPGLTADQTGIPAAAQAAGNPVDHGPVTAGHLCNGICLPIHIHAFAFNRSIQEFPIEGAAVLKIQSTEAAELTR